MHGSPPGSAEPERLPPGRHGLPRSFIASNQRSRIVAAMLRVLPRRGYAETTIGQITREAGVSRTAFYAQFGNKEECFLATYDLAAEWLCGRIEAAADGEAQWTARVRAAVAEAMRLLAANPDLAHLIAVEAQQAGPPARRRRQACIARLADALRAGRPQGSELPSELEELLVGGVFVHVARYVDADCLENLPDATAELVRYLLIPYLDG